ncbi:MAG: TadE/TadG family type IV pilus assembly protein [Magnetovibrionaceae bacterium]
MFARILSGIRLRFVKPASLQGGAALGCDRGSLAIEFAFLSSALITVTVSIIEFGLIMLAAILMETGLRDASRFGITGREIQGETRIDSIRAIVGQTTIGLIDMNLAQVDVKVYPSFGKVGQGEDYIDGNGNGAFDSGETFMDENDNGIWDADLGVAGAGGSGDVVLYRLSYDWKLLTPVGQYLIGGDGTKALSVAVAVRNEPWDVGIGPLGAAEGAE